MKEEDCVIDISNEDEQDDELAESVIFGEIDDAIKEDFGLIDIKGDLSSG